MDSPTESRSRFAFVAINILAWVLIFCFPFFMTPRNETMTLYRYLGFCVSTLTYMVTFYVNYLWLIKSYLSRRKWITFFAINILCIILMCTLLYGWHNYYMSHLLHIPGGRFMPPPLHGFLFARDILFMGLTISMAVAIRMTLEWQRSEREKAKVQVVATQAEIKNLKSQLNPHFLFNTLNNIYSLMRVDADKAQDAVLSLSKTLRFVLYDENQEQVPLEKEIEFTRNYIQLMSLRLADNVTLTVDLPPIEAAAGRTVAPLLFISLVENAFKHGISQTAPSFISIHLSLDHDVLKCRIDNSYFPKDNRDLSGSGIGIENLQRRLDLLYPGHYLYSQFIEDNTYTTQLILTLTSTRPWNPSPAS